MRENPIQVSLPLLRNKPSTSYLFYINKNPYYSIVAPKHLPNDIPGRHAHNDQASTGVDLSSTHSDLPPAETGICKLVLKPS